MKLTPKTKNQCTVFMNKGEWLKCIHSHYSSFPASGLHPCPYYCTWTKTQKECPSHLSFPTLAWDFRGASASL